MNWFPESQSLENRTHQIFLVSTKVFDPIRRSLAPCTIVGPPGQSPFSLAPHSISTSSPGPRPTQSSRLINLLYSGPTLGKIPSQLLVLPPESPFSAASQASQIIRLAPLTPSYSDSPPSLYTACSVYHHTFIYNLYPIFSIVAHLYSVICQLFIRVFLCPSCLFNRWPIHFISSETIIRRCWWHHCAYIGPFAQISPLQSIILTPLWSLLAKSTLYTIHP